MSKINRLNFEKTYAILWAVFLIVFLIAPKISTFVIIISLLFFVISLINKKVIFRFHRFFIPITALYIAYLIGAFFTNNIPEAQKLLENKLSLLFIPLLFSFDLENKNQFLRTSVLGLTFGVILSSFYGLINAIINYSESHSILSFMTIGISPIHHPTYFVVFHIFSVSLVLYGYKSKWKGFILYWIIPFVFFSLIIQGLCLSLAGLLFLFASVFIIILFFLKKILSQKLFRISVFIVPTILTGITFSIPQFEGEFNGAFKYANSYFSNPVEFIKSREGSLSGTEERLIMWTVTFQEIKKHPFGVGTGNLDVNLQNRLKSYGLHKLAEKNYNPHNQFLQTTLEIGIFGFIILATIIGIVLYQSFILKNGLLLILGTNLLFNSLFESMLQRQSGIVFYVFWIVLLLIIFQKSNLEKNEVINTDPILSA